MARHKMPKKPKRSSSLKVWENYDKRVKAHHAKISGIGAAKRKKEALIKKYS